MKDLRRHWADRGFTLLEIMIAISIMSALSVLTYQAVRNTANNRGKIQDLIRNETKLGDSLRVMEHDISRAFHYRNIHFEALKESREALAKAAGGAGQPNQPNQGVPNVPPPPSAAINLEPLQPPPNYTGFIGRSDALYLTTLSHYRTRENSLESDQLTVGFLLKNCPTRPGQDPPVGQCLFRSRKYFFERDLERGGEEDLVVENVHSLSFRYFGDGADDWTDRWVSTDQGEEFSRGKFPLAVEVSLSLYTSNRAAEGQSAPPTLHRTIIVPIRFPNNPKGPRSAPASGVRDVEL